MANHAMTITVEVEDAFSFIVRCLRQDQPREYGRFGYDLYLSCVMIEYLKSVHNLTRYSSPMPESYLPTISPSFYAAAWELCRRGILRPGRSASGELVTPEGSDCEGYSLTPLGREWLQRAEQYDYVQIEPGRIARLLDNFCSRFGPGYRERCQEAIGCYHALAYLACCAMCGAATESIILALAIAKQRDEEAVLREYRSAQGVSRIENHIIGNKSKGIQSQYRGCTDLLKYWRNEAAHGQQSKITEIEAYTSLTLLLRFAQFAHEQWNELIQ